MTIPEVTEELRARVKIEKERRATIKAELEAVTGRRAGDVVALDQKRILLELRARVRDVRSLLGQDIPRTRRILTKLLVGRLECRAFQEGDRAGYRFTGRGSYTELLPSNLSTEVVTPAGFEPAISTLKGSRPWPG